MSNEEAKEEVKTEQPAEQTKCDGDCTACEGKCENTPKSNTMPNGEKVVSFTKEPNIVDVANMLMSDEGFLNTTKDASIVATRVLKHANGQDAVLQVFFHKKNASNIIVTNEMPKEK